MKKKESKLMVETRGLGLATAYLSLLLWSPKDSSSQNLRPSDADAALEKTMVALGGTRAIAELESLSVEAVCSGPAGPFQTLVKSRRPAKTYFRQKSESKTIEIWSTPELTWIRDAEGNIKEAEESLRHFIRAHEFHFLVFELETRFSGHRVAGSDTFGGKPCLVVDMNDDQDNPAAVCLDTATSLPVMLELNPPNAQGPVRVFFNDWHWIDGVRYFRSFRLTEGENRIFTYDYERISPNSVTSNEFRIPARLLQND